MANAALCDLCAVEPAVWYCAADSASLCAACDEEFHSTNEIFVRHKRVPVGVVSETSTEASDKPCNTGETRDEILREAYAAKILLEVQVNQLLELEDDSTPEFLHTVIDLYIVDTVDIIQKLDEQVNSSTNEFSEIRMSLHKLRGGSVNIGAAQVEEACLKVREYCINLDAPNVVLCFQDLKAKVEIVRNVFQRLKEAVLREAAQK
ncbi:hypothetical protein CYMTET_38098 [Cymbomonas tetramitiformis]|uniref:Histidine-containing phosphotransfer protein n=1 Tax=Cymbomonas tetramitiformis TaxID=36881 RepID=A0AAE0CE67_9CHLO|nr:hypothetical protein CYMTET_38098 [Cymbomonas tetramitiformis]